jgi:O-succinylbenzoate synthase
LELEVKPYTLNFTFDAQTSRGKMSTRDVWFLEISRHDRTGIGEVAPIRGLSPENPDDLQEVFTQLKKDLKEVELPTNPSEALKLAKALSPDGFPSVRFGLETALLDWVNGGKKAFFKNDFTAGGRPIPINGLVWMSSKDEMIRQIDEKLEAGFDCIKLKVGSLDFEEELAVLKYLREKAPLVTVRLDANGAFETNEVLYQLKALAAFGIHSIEQPIAPRQEEAMTLLIDKSPIPIALDEELIGIYGKAKTELIKDLRPDFLVLKPTLLGGFTETAEWINLATQFNIQWWITSYLESNIGLNAIAQFVGNYPVELPQGLGTGGLYSNNIESPLNISEGMLSFEISR